MKKYPLIALTLGAAAVLGYLVARDGGSETGVTRVSQADCRGAPEHDEMVWIEGGSFTRGATGFYPDEGPPEEIRVGGFWIDRFEVTNARFGEFVATTGYVTVAERQPDPEDFPGIDPALLQPGSVVFTMPTDTGGELTQWWRFVPGANWREPTGPGSSIEGLENHPVAHVTHEDAQAFAGGWDMTFRLRRNGNTRPGAAWTGPCTPGAMSSWLTGGTRPTPGRGCSP